MRSKGNRFSAETSKCGLNALLKDTSSSWMIVRLAVAGVKPVTRQEKIYVLFIGLWQLLLNTS